MPGHRTEAGDSLRMKAIAEWEAEAAEKNTSGTLGRLAGKETESTME